MIEVKAYETAIRTTK